MAEKTKQKPIMRRPSLFTIKELLEEIRKARMDDKFSMASYSFLLGSPVSNRRDLAAYLRLLVELGWLSKKEQNIAGKKTVFHITDKGIRFLRLFPRKNQGNAVTK
ncbi:MAG: hypothetical protein PXY39_02145 [archaeon]|nr:hypothetical protein [archaeon]